MNINKLISFGISLPNATDLSRFFSSVAYVADFTSTDLVDGVSVPTGGYFTLTSQEDNANTFKSSTQFYLDLQALFSQNGNAAPNQGQVKYCYVFQKTTSHTNWGAAVTALLQVKADFSQLLISSRTAADITSVAAVVESNNRLFEAETADTNVSTGASGSVALALAAQSYANTKLTYTSTAADAVSAGICGIQTNEKLGSTGDVYSAISGVIAREYTSSVETALDNQNVSYYTTVNAVNGGGVDSYAKKIYYGGKMINGEDAKRRRIRFYLEYMMKATALDFLAKKTTYQDSSGAILESMLSALLIEAQNYDMIVRDTEESKGFYLNVLSMADTKKNYISLYNTQTYKVVGWYVDALTSRKVEINLTVDPSDAEKALIQ